VATQLPAAFLLQSCSSVARLHLDKSASGSFRKNVEGITIGKSLRNSTQTHTSPSTHSPASINSLDEAQAKLVDTISRMEKLAPEVAASRSKAQAIYSPEDLLNAIRSGDPKLRLKLKAEIAKRILRIEINWNKDGTILPHHLRERCKSA
jgi:hypothetical protein